MRFESLLVPAITTAAATLAACGGDDGAEGGADAAVDARVYDPRLCVPPATIDDPLVVNGGVFTPGVGPVAGVTVEIVRESDGVVLASATSDASGEYALPGVATGGAPIPGHIRMSKSGHYTMHYYTVDGLRFTSFDTGVYPVGFFDAELTGIGVTLDPAMGFVSALVRACNSNNFGAGVNGATVDFLPGTRTYYVDAANLWAPDQTATRAPGGEADDFFVPPGRATVEVTYQQRTTAVEVQSIAGELTQIVYYP